MLSIKDYVECWGLGGAFSGHPKQRVGFKEWQKSDHRKYSQSLKIWKYLPVSINIHERLLESIRKFSC